MVNITAYTELTGTGCEPHSTTDGLCFQAASGDLLKFHKFNDETPSPGLITVDL